MYDLDWLKSKIESGDAVKYLFFWGHSPNKSGITTSSCLSQWWACNFENEGVRFKSAEHWMMYQKARLFADTKIADEILKSETPGEAKALGRQVAHFENDTWNDRRMEIVIQGNILKFSQNEDLQTFLINTKERILVEASPIDEIWGVGLSKDSDKIYNPNTWRGLNLLGFALMEVRNILQK